MGAGGARREGWAPLDGSASSDHDGVVSDRSPPGQAERVVLESELADVERRREAADGAYRRHVLWLLLGLSPGALVPALYALTEWGGGAVVAVVLAVCVTESVQALRSKREVARLDRAALGLRTDLEALEASEAGADDRLAGGPGR